MITIASVKQFPTKPGMRYGDRCFDEHSDWRLQIRVPRRLSNSELQQIKNAFEAANGYCRGHGFDDVGMIYSLQIIAPANSRAEHWFFAQQSAEMRENRELELPLITSSLTTDNPDGHGLCFDHPCHS